jgi:uncharacterized protein YkwD
MTHHPTYMPHRAKLDVHQADFLRRLNTYRLENNLVEVIPEAYLSNLALNRIVEKVAAKDESHFGTESVFQAAKIYGFKHGQEILSFNYASISATFRKYQESFDHNNIMLSNRLYVGLGVYTEGPRIHTCILFANHEI